MTRVVFNDLGISNFMNQPNGFWARYLIEKSEIVRKTMIENAEGILRKQVDLSEAITIQYFVGPEGIESEIGGPFSNYMIEKEAREHNWAEPSLEAAGFVKV